MPTLENADISDKGAEQRGIDHHSAALATRRWGRLLVLSLVVVVGLGATLIAAKTFEQEEQQVWEVEGKRLAETLSELIIGWLSESQSPMSGLAALVENTSALSEDKFLNAFDSLEARSTASFLDGAAIVSLDYGGQPNVLYSTDIEGALKPGSVFLDGSRLRQVFDTALVRFGEIVFGEPINDPVADTILLPVALATTADAGDVTLVGLIDVSAVVSGLVDMRVPTGVGLNITGRFPLPNGPGEQVDIIAQAVDVPVFETSVRTVIAGTDISFEWTFSSDFNSGIDNHMSILAYAVGAIVTAGVFFIILFFQNQNALIRQKVLVATLELRRSEEQIRNLLNSAPVGMGVVNIKTGERIFANNELVQMLGAKDFGDLTSRPLEDTYADRSDIDSIRSLLRGGEGVRSIEIVRKRLDGSSFWCLQSNQPIGEFQGIDSGVVWMVDISNAKSAEEALALQKSIVDTALDSINQGISIFNEDLRLVSANRRFLEIFDYPDSFSEPGTPLESILRYNAERGEYGAGDVNDQVQERMDLARRFQPHTFQRTLDDGRVIEIFGSPIDTGGVVATYTDVSDFLNAQRSARLLEEALDTFADMVILYDKNENVVFSNDRYHEIYPKAPPKSEIRNYTMESLLQRSLDAGLIGHPLAKSDPKAWLAKSLADRRRPDGGAGETTHSNGRTYFFRYERTTEGGIILLQSDITSRKEMENELREREQQLSKILESSPIAVGISLDDQSEDDGIIQYANPRLMDLLKMGPEELGQARTVEFVSERSGHVDHEALLDQGISIEHQETRVVSRDGSEHWCLLSISPIQYQHKKSALIWLVEISELKDKEQELAQKEAQLRMALENMPGAMIVVDPLLRVTLVNERYRDFYGDPKGRVHEGAMIYDILADEVERDMLVGQTELNQILEERLQSFVATDTSVFEDRTTDGRFIQMTRKPTEDGHTISVAVDITKIKESEQALRETYALISSSIDYASRIQRAVLPTQQDMNFLLDDWYILWEPRDNVGGDLYWCKAWGTGTLVALGDCTGHGVPGAFVTLIATGALEQAMKEGTTGRPGTLLERMHVLMQQTLGQREASDRYNDGLEIGVCYIDPVADEIVFSGARFSVFVHRPDPDEIVEIRGDKRGIGYSDLSGAVRFSEQRISWSEGDSFHMVSDGLIDQIGGDKRRGFGKRRYIQALEDAMTGQFGDVGSNLRKTLEDHQGNEIRRDDVSAIGFKL